MPTIAPLVELAAGKVHYILCEKPIATTVDDAEAMIELCRERGSKLQIAFPVRFHPVFAQLKQMLDRGELGRILSVECTNHGSMPGGWFVERASPAAARSSTTRSTSSTCCAGSGARR